MFHWVRGVPFEFNAGAYDNLNMWEQIDNGDQYTPAKKFLLAVPIVLFLLSTHYTHYDLTSFTLNFLAVLAVVIPKLPFVSHVQAHEPKVVPNASIRAIECEWHYSQIYQKTDNEQSSICGVALFLWMEVVWLWNKKAGFVFSFNYGQTPGTMRATSLTRFIHRYPFFISLKQSCSRFTTDYSSDSITLGRICSMPQLRSAQKLGSGHSNPVPG